MLVSVLLGAVACSPEASRSDDRGDETAACAAGELEPLAACRQANCADVPPEEVKTCVPQHCAAELGALSQTCKGCLVSTKGTPQEVAEVCTAQPEFPCEDGELTPLGQCRAANCADVPPDKLQACVATNCASQVGALSETCRGCLLETPPADVAAVCLPPIPAAPEPRCAATELDLLTTCATALCADASPEGLHQCAVQRCFQPFVALSQTCMACLGPDEPLATAKDRCVVGGAP